jgi:hypothetical protein
MKVADASTLATTTQTPLTTHYSLLTIHYSLPTFGIWNLIIWNLPYG